MTLIELVVAVIFLWLSVLVGATAYDNTHNLCVSVLAGTLILWAIPLIGIAGRWLHGRLRKRHPNEGPPSDAAASDGTGVQQAKRRWTEVLTMLSATLVLVVIGQAVYAGSGSRFWALVSMAWPFAILLKILTAMAQKRPK